MTDQISPDDIQVTSSTEDTTGTEGDGQAPDVEAPEGQDVATGTEGDDDAGSQDDSDEVDVEKLRAQLVRVRRENAKARVAAKAALDAREASLAEAETARAKAVEDAKTSLAGAVQKALGLAPDEADALTPEQVLEKITKERDEEKAARALERAERLELLREVAIQDAAAAHGADAEKLLDSRAFMRSVEALDATDKAAFRTAVMTAVEKAAEDNAAFKTRTKPAPPAASGGTTVAGSAPRDLDRMSVDELIDAGFTKRR